MQVQAPEARLRQAGRAALAALVICLGLPATALAATTAIFSGNFNDGSSGAVTGAGSLGTATGSWSFNGAAHGGVSSDADKAAAFVHNLSAVTGMTLMASNGVVVGTTYPVTNTVDAGGSSGKALIANFAQPGSFTNGGTTTISFKWGQFGLANSGAFKYGFVRGLDASGNEVFELLFTHLNPATSSQIYRRAAGDSRTTNTSATVSTPQGTVLITAFPDSSHSGTTVATKPTGLLGVTITLTNGQVTYAFSKGTASANALTYPVNSAATNITKLEFSETWNSTLGDVASNSKGYWLDDVSVTTTTYTLTYDGNGNTGGTAPTDGSSPYPAGATVTVLGNTGSLTKIGNSGFYGWNTAANGSGTAYSTGNTFNITNSTTLYAQWSATVAYNGNGNTGGTVPTDASSPYLAGSTVTVLGNTGSLTNTGNTFNNWNTAANGSGAAYSAGNTFTIATNTTLYAQWLGSATITAASATLTNAVSTIYGSNSSPQSVSVSGSSLTADITASAPSGLEVSSDSSTFGATATFSQSGGNASGTLSVRLKSNAPVGSYNSQNVALTSSGAPTVNVSTTASGNNVSAKALTIASATAQDKLHDGSVNAIVTGTLQSAEAFGAGNSTDGKPYIGDSLTVTCPGSTFANSAVGAGVSVTAGTFGVAGSAAGNYMVIQPSLSLTASILGTAVWTNTVAAATWGTAANWTNNIIATNTDNTADFSQVDIPADTTVNLTTPLTIGSLIFGDTETSGTPAGWTLANSSTPANILTLAGTVPTITVNALGSGKSATISAVVGGSSGLGKAGSGMLSLSGANTYSGGTTIANGTLQLGSANTLGSGNVTVLSGGTLDLNAFWLTNKAYVVHLAGTGVTNGGALVHNGTGQINFAVTNLVLDADASIGGANRFDVRLVGSVASEVNLGTHTLTKVRGNTVFFQQIAPITNGNITVESGTLGLTAVTITNGSGLLTVKNGAELRLFRNSSFGSSFLTCPMTLEAGALLAYSGTDTTDAIDQSVNSAITLAGDATNSVSTAGAVFELAGVISGSGGINKTGAGTSLVSGANTYFGNTTVSGGVLALSGPGSLSNSPNLIVSAGATLDVSAVSGGAFNLAAGQTLKGNGAVNGTVVVTGDAIVAPGTSVGILYFTNAPTLSGTTAMEINKTGVTLTNDKLVRVGGSLAYGGTLTVTTLGGSDPLTGGEAFDLFDATSFTGAFAATNLPALSSGNWWTGMLGVNGSIIVNRPPTASTNLYTRGKGTSAKIFKTDLMSLASDPDTGDSVTYDALVGFGSQSASVSEDGNIIYYAPANDNSDTIQYRVKDARGGTTTNSIQINVVSREGQARAVVPSGSTVTVSFAGIPGRGYEIQRTTNLVDWATLVTTSAPPQGLFEWVDSFSDLGFVPASAYYRLRQP